jgi:2-oxoglutarate/2-oxoacid ferredoxin oxidoreductase subunit beta
MTAKYKEKYAGYLRPEAFPSTFCPGCSHIPLMEIVLDTVKQMELSMDEILFASGIGCAAWIPSPHYLADTLHTLHGRAIAFATGAKLANPTLDVFVISGDGDLASIGGNHLIHAARRDIDMVVICANNFIYGMTGGQVAATTPIGHKTLTTPKGNVDRPFDLVNLVRGAGAGFTARWYAGMRKELIESIVQAHEHKGFSFIDVISICPTAHGRRNKPPGTKKQTPIEKSWFVSKEDAAAMSADELAGKYVVGQWGKLPIG